LNTERDRILSELLLVRYQRGDASALEGLVKQWESRLFYYIMRLVSDEDDAWDALQETWLAFVKSAKSLRRPRSLAMWLYATARHKAMDKLRLRYDDREFCADFEDIAERDPAIDEFKFEDAAHVHAALGRIPAAHREVLTLFFLDDLSLREVADVLDIPPGTVKSRLHFARKSLRAVLEEEEAAL
jgi:RNA polymerase sigma factor (sigma-70 family)